MYLWNENSPRFEKVMPLISVVIIVQTLEEKLFVHILLLAGNGSGQINFPGVPHKMALMTVPNDSVSCCIQLCLNAAFWNSKLHQ